MFYSHTFLARKGPLGTVWCAAHLQSRLKKSEYASTNISKTVECILYPEVPIALRMSGHLLLGVVRIYEKKVEYLHQDCKFLLIGFRKAFAPSEVNLPEDATHAPFHSVTLPDKFELDALDLDDDYYHEGSYNKHLRSPEDITLADQIPTGRDPYVAIAIGEDGPRDSSNFDDAVGYGPRQVEEDSPSIPDGNTGFQDPGSSIQRTPIVGSGSENLPIEILRKTVPEFPFENVPKMLGLPEDRLERDPYLENIFKEKDTSSPEMAEILVPDPPQQSQKLPSASSERENFDSHISFERALSELALRSTPPLDQPQARMRKRKLRFDESTVLSNEYAFSRKTIIDMALENSGDLVRKRKESPCSTLDIWNLTKRLKKDKVFFEPLLTGLCSDLCNIYKNEFSTIRPHLVSSEESRPEPSVVQSPERIRNYEGPDGSNVFPEPMHSSIRSMPSPFRGGDFTPPNGSSLGSPSDQVGKTVPTPESERETPRTLEELRGFESTGLSDIPELMDSAEEDLAFLEQDNTPAGLQGTPEVEFVLRKHNETPEVHTLSVRTRVVAQFLKGKSSASPFSDDVHEVLSLNKILEGKRRKVCARMVFETLVLRSRGLVDLEQEEPYGDISLKVTTKLSKGHYPGCMDMVAKLLREQENFV
ncbi:hypothetical protein RJ640_028972 [Escallonia rubra]|uniref:Uncharacterized protein n=1 Tax=Escallonia rubra TaxID=112253 RepID=A0AA88UUA2_9ASTE|nr:hypothetical protein RJ640_028972 [Escallonia rubra]